jgi:hypothetical protein
MMLGYMMRGAKEREEEKIILFELTFQQGGG